MISALLDAVGVVVVVRWLRRTVAPGRGQ